MAVIAWECSSQGKLFLGPDMAELTAANVHPESGLHPVAPEFKNAFFSQFTRLSKSSYGGEDKYFSSSQQYAAKAS